MFRLHLGCAYQLVLNCDQYWKTFCKSLQFLDVLLSRGIVESQQETIWVCRATGQEPQDKRKEAQMEVQGLKLNSIPKAQKINIQQPGL